MKIVQNLKLSPSIARYIHLALLDHDIGRFPQAVVFGSFSDALVAKAKLFTGKDHCEWGSYILQDSLLKAQIPNTRKFDSSISKIVKYHGTGNLPSNLDHNMAHCDFLRYEDAFAICNKNSDYLEQILMSTTEQILQDVDRLDIYHQILSGSWIPLKTEDVVDPKVYEMFYQKQYLNMGELRAQGLWNPNVGELVRLGFIQQLKLVSVAQMILDEQLILKMQQLRNNPCANEAFAATQQYLADIIRNSEDGIYVNHHVKRVCK